MGDGGQRSRWEYWWVALRFSLLLCFGEQVSAQIRYSIPEEVKEGSVVGNVAKDLGLDVSTLVERRFRIVSGSGSEEALFQVNQNNGVLYVHKNIDREGICNSKVACVIDLKIVVENPLEVHYVGLEITDVNDHSPSFSEKNLHIEIAENKPPGARFELQPARDLDVGINSIGSYKLNQNEHFDLELRDSGEGDKIPFLVLQKALDREQKTKHVLLLTAFDGGNPPRSGTLNITVTVLDLNDNQPVCSQDVYSVTLQENSDIGRFVVRINATDADHGSNGVIEYTLGRNLKRRVHDIFQLDSITGEIKVKGPVDFEENEVYSINVQASDKGQPPLTTDCRVIVKIQDVNDNRPQIEVTSLSNTVSEDSKPGTPPLSTFKTLSVQISDVNDNRPEFSQNPFELYLVENNAGVSANGSAEGVEEIPRNVNAGHLVTKVRAYDADIGYNGWLLFSLQEVTDHSLFALDRYTGQIRTLRSFTETDEAAHKLVILVKDNGNVSLSATATVIINAVEPKEAFAASDVKSAVKDEEENRTTFYLIITLGSVSALFLISIIVLIVMQCSKPTEYSSKYLQDANYDGTLCHSIQYRSGDKRYMLVGPRMSIGSTIVPGSNGNTLVLPEHRSRASGEDCVYVSF
ncbi:unnamed protein product [Coregonus sp. 'balchen']|nr:unnamed protein product [Coregonus sp. 'balchen']